MFYVGSSHFYEIGLHRSNLLETLPEIYFMQVINHFKVKLTVDLTWGRVTTLNIKTLMMFNGMCTLHNDTKSCSIVNYTPNVHTL